MFSPLARVLSAAVLVAGGLVGGALWWRTPGAETPPAAAPLSEEPQHVPPPAVEAARIEPTQASAPEPKPAEPAPKANPPKENLRILDFSVELESTMVPVGKTLSALLRVRNASSAPVPITFTLDPAEGYVYADIAVRGSSEFRRCASQDFRCRPVRLDQKLTSLRPGEELSRRIDMTLLSSGDEGRLRAPAPGAYTLRFYLNAGTVGGGILRIEDILLTLSVP